MHQLPFLVCGSLVLLAPPVLAQSKVQPNARSVGAEIPRIMEVRGMEPDELLRQVLPLDRVDAQTQREGTPGVEVILDRSGAAWAVLAGDRFADLADDPVAALRWAQRAKGLLGLGAFDLMESSPSTTSLGKTRHYALHLNGYAVFASSVDLHWEGDRFAGATASAPRQLAQVDDAPRNRRGRHEYVPYSRSSGTTDLVLATVTGRVLSGSRQEWTYTPAGHAPFRVIEHGPIIEHPGAEAALRQITAQLPANEVGAAPPFSQWNTPGVGFPDQLDLVPGGRVWLSAPSNDRILSFSQNTEVFNAVATQANDTPDGLIVDASGTVWYGAYGTSRLVSYTPATDQFSYFTPPVNVDNMAVPATMSNGHVLVTDHGGWLCELDPASGSWVQTDRTAAANPHLVAASEDTVHQNIMTTQYNVRRLGVRPVAGGSIVDVLVPGSRSPAFLEATGGITYFSLWNDSSLGAYDPATGQMTFHEFPLSAGEIGGPMDVTPGGDVVVGTRGSGFIVVYRPASGRMTAHPIPTSNPGLKDGLRCGEDGVVWFTESGAGKLSRLRYLQ